MKAYYSVMILSLGLGFSAWGEDKDDACKPLKDACEAAGFTKGAHKEDKKGLFFDCVRPVMSGKTVPGVTVAKADIDACKAKAVMKRQGLRHGK